VSDVSLAMNRIAAELKRSNPSKKKILNFLYDLQLYDFEFLNSIGKTYKLNPLFFMKTLYSNIWKKMGKLLGKGGRTRAERYIIENFCLRGGEQIMYQCEGSVKKKKPIDKPSIKITVDLGVLFFTNQRIIAQGRLTISELVQATAIASGGSIGEERKIDLKEDKKFLFEPSELCFGYCFQVKSLTDLRKSGRKLSYNLVDGKTTLNVKKEQVDKLLDILSQFQS
jgi:hypothetical protein